MNPSIELIKKKLLVKYPFFGTIIANSNFIERYTIDTAGTDGKDMYYNPEFVGELSDDQQLFVFAHETCHIAFDHIMRSEGKDPETWNIATDAVVNAFLTQDGLEMIEGGVEIDGAINYNAEELYEKLLKEKEEKEQNNSKQNQQENNQSNNSSKQDNSNNENSSSNNDSNFNEQESNNNQNSVNNHNIWKEAIENKKRKEQKENKEDDTEKNQEENSTNKKNQQKQKLEEEVKKISQIGEKKAFNQNKIDRKKQLEELKNVLAKESMGAGNTTNSNNLNINDIGTAKALIDWRKLLIEAVRIEADWSYRNATIEEGVVTPHLEELPQPETEIVLDTSGSIDETLLKNFLRECKNILKTTKLKVGCFDTKFYGFTAIRTEEDIDNMVFLGGGGTDFDVAVNAFSNRVENKIIFTDGDASMPSKSVNAIWIVFGNKKINPPGGRVIYINEESLEKLCFSYSNNIDNNKNYK